tara:strand:+ start:2835 stop:4052 length:1218 start_codon:yes stop_codon:yes gene_type:complete
MKNSITIWTLILVCLSVGCVEDKDTQTLPPPTPSSTIIKSGQITQDETWDSSKTILLNGRVVVTNGVTLTIKPGTLIKAEAGQEANATTLIIARGAKIMAEGTVRDPIIFTSIADNIQMGEMVSPNLNSTFSGLWGGILILGKAPISAQGGVLSTQIDGIPASDTNGLYGGNYSLDNSGVLKYVSIRHGGALIGAGNEINGLTLGGVGSGTTIENIEVVANFDDGIEWFGGSVNCTNLIVWHQGDDAFDIDQSYSGTINNIVCMPNESSDHILEIDGPEGSMDGSFTLTNGTFIGDSTLSGEYADFRDGARGDLTNLCFQNFSPNSDVEIDDVTTSDNYKSGVLNFNYPWEFQSTQTFSQIFVDKSGGNSFTDSSFMYTTKTNSVGANTLQFVGWTLADRMGMLN